MDVSSPIPWPFAAVNPVASGNLSQTGNQPVPVHQGRKPVQKLAVAGRWGLLNAEQKLVEQKYFSCLIIRVEGQYFLGKIGRLHPA